MKRVIIHWTAGASYPNATDKSHYHYVVDKDGKVHKCTHDVLDNENCKDNDYAEHTGQGNTGSIGLSMCGMAGFNMKTKATDYPLTDKQVQATCLLAAKMCDAYGITPSLDTIDTHYTYNQKHGITTGKIDIVYLPCFPRFKPMEILPFLINKINWYYSAIKQGKIKNEYKK
jgi:hypothetical protein